MKKKPSPRAKRPERVATARTVRHLTCFDKDLLPGTADSAIAVATGNSRQVVRTPSGLWLIGLSTERGLVLSAGKGARLDGGGFEKPVLLIGHRRTGLLGRAKGRPGGFSLIVNLHGLPHAFWHDARGIHHAERRAGARSARDLRDARAWSKPALLVEDAEVADVLMCRGGVLRLLYVRKELIGLATLRNARWRCEDTSIGGSEPVMVEGADGTLHIAFAASRRVPCRIAQYSGERLEERIGYLSWAPSGCSPVEWTCEPIAHHPAIAVVNGEPLIVYQHEGFREIGFRLAQYVAQREGAGSSIAFAWRHKGGWVRGNVALATEAVVSERGELLVPPGSAQGRKRVMENPALRKYSVINVFEDQLYLMPEQLRRPKLACDAHGVIWAFWPDTTRRHVYFARWLGERFSAPMESRGGFYQLSQQVMVERAAPQGAAQIGLVTVAADRAYWGRQIVPSLSTRDRRHVLFLDLLELADMRDLEQALGQPQRYWGNPVFRPGPAGSPDDLYVALIGVQRRAGRFVMHYGCAGTLKCQECMTTAVAYSRDGIHWERPRLGLLEVGGHRDNNLIPRVTAMFDPAERDPAKRYKGCTVLGHWITDRERRVAYSPDGIHWRFGRRMVGMDTLFEAGGPTLRDPMDIPERRFKGYGRTGSSAGRAGGMLWSQDFVHWHGYEALLDLADPYGKPARQWRERYLAGRVLDPAAERAGEQIYWNTHWIEHELHLCLYGVMAWDGRYHAALAVSRDGFHFVRVCNGQYFLPCGPRGEWDAGSIGMGVWSDGPPRVGDELWLYYTGRWAHHGTDHIGPAWAAIGLAKLRGDGWACLRKRREAACGVATTIPIKGTSLGPVQLFVNAEGLRSDGRGHALRVEVCDADALRPLAGFEAAKCLPFSREALESAVRWRGGRNLSQLAGQRFRLRFYLSTCEVKLYSFHFS